MIQLLVEVCQSSCPPVPLVNGIQVHEVAEVGHVDVPGTLVHKACSAYHVHVPAPESAAAVIVCEQLVTLTLSLGSRVQMVLKISAQCGEPDMRPISRDALKVSNLVLHAQIERHPLNGLDPLDLRVVQQRPLIGRW